MESKLIAGLILAVLIMSNAQALSGKYMYVALSYGQGWWPWVCTTEKGMQGVWGRDYQCSENNVRGCPFEQGKMFGQLLCVSPGFIGACSASAFKSCTSHADEMYQIVLPPSYGILSRISVPEDFKLTMVDGTVVGDEVCVGDQIKVDKGVNKGEYWDDGGNDDSPPIYWVDDVEALVKKVMAYHERTTTTWNEICSKKIPADGFVDPLSGVPVYTTATQMLQAKKPAYITGNMVCSLKAKGGVGSGSFTATAVGEMNIQATYDVECMYYYYGGVTASGYSDMGYWSDFSEGSCPFMILRVPTVLQDGPSATVWSYNDHPYASSAADFFKVGTVGLDKVIKVTSPVTPHVEISFSGSQVPTPGTPMNQIVQVKNTGRNEIKIIDPPSSFGYKLVSCDSEVLKTGGVAECLVTVTPQAGQGLRLDMAYEYKSCGRTKTGSVSKVLIESTAVTPASSAQVYSIDVHGDCENQYYGCYAPDNDGKFAAGYKCYNTGDQYYSPVKERFNLRFNLPDLSSKTVVGASLNLFASWVNRAQEVRVFSGKVDWAPTSCSASGDICSRPYCEQCAPSFDFAGGAERAAQTIGSGGKVSFDLSDVVKEAYSGGLSALSLQLRGEEDLWSSAGKDSCSRKDEWIKQDAEFVGIIGSKPYLEIVYADANLGLETLDKTGTNPASTTAATSTKTSIRASASATNIPTNYPTNIPTNYPTNYPTNTNIPIPTNIPDGGGLIDIDSIISSIESVISEIEDLFSSI